MISVYDLGFNRFAKDVLGEIASVYPLDLATIIHRFFMIAGFGPQETEYMMQLFKKANFHMMRTGQKSYCLHEYRTSTRVVTLSDWKLSGKSLVIQSSRKCPAAISEHHPSGWLIGIAHGHLCSFDTTKSMLHLLHLAQFRRDLLAKSFTKQSRGTLVAAFMKGEMACLLLTNKVMLLDKALSVSRELTLPISLLKDLEDQVFHLLHAVDDDGTLEVCLWHTTKLELLFLKGTNNLVIRLVIRPPWVENAEGIFISNGFYLVIKQNENGGTSLLFCTLIYPVFEIYLDSPIRVQSWFWEKDTFHVLSVKNDGLYHHVFGPKKKFSMGAMDE